MPRLFDESKLLRSRPLTLSELIERVESVLSASDGTPRVRAAILRTSGPSHWAEGVEPAWRQRSRTLWARADGHALDLSTERTSREAEPRTGALYLHQVSPGSHATVATTLSGREFTERVVRPFLKFNRHWYDEYQITHSHLLETVRRLRAALALPEFVIVRASSRTRYSRAGVRRRLLPSVSWPQMGVEEAFEWVDSQDGWFERLTIAAGRGGVPHLTVGISRDGWISTNRRFGAIFESVLLPMARGVDEDASLFGRRDRKGTENRQVRPLRMVFGEGTLQGGEDLMRLRESLTAYTSATVSLVHSNPYFHASLADHIDGTACDVWAFSGDSLLLVPQLRATAPGIARLVAHVSNTFAEGRVEDWDPGL